MTYNIPAAKAFLARHGRLLDRRRAEVLLGEGSDAAVVAAALAYRNADGGYGWGLEPDLRSSGSQPGGALHAFEAFAAAPSAVGSAGVELCDWLDEHSLADGGVPFALPVDDPAGVAPFWADADALVSSLQITAAVTAQAHRLAVTDHAVAGHQWLARATRYCVGAIEVVESAPFAIELNFALQFLDATYDVEPKAPALLEKLMQFVPPTGAIPVVGGAPGETIRPLHITPLPDRPLRRFFDPQIIDSELTRLAAEQGADGGWRVDFQSYSAAAELEWSGYATVGALTTLMKNGR